jgi:hypothetical protein
MQLQLKIRSLSSILAKLNADRQRLILHTRYPLGTRPEIRLTDTVAAFMRARQYVPVDRCCLVDSLSLIRFIAKRGFFANLVFAVTGTPFSAHCWAQAGAVVLNDTVGNTHAHTPIRVM